MPPPRLTTIRPVLASPDWPDPYLLTQVAGRSVHLDSGRPLTYDAAGPGEPVNVDAQAVIAWREQVLVFNNST